MKVAFAVIDDEPTAPRKLERHLLNHTQVIAIEGRALGLATARTIQLGNFCHKAAVLIGLGSGVAMIARAPVQRVVLPLTASGLLFALLYNVCMHPDPLSQYQVDQDGDEARIIPASCLKPAADGTPKFGGTFGLDCLYLVLARRDDFARVLLHNVITVGTGVALFFYSGWTIGAVAAVFRRGRNA